MGRVPILHRKTEQGIHFLHKHPISDSNLLLILSDILAHNLPKQRDSSYLRIRMPKHPLDEDLNRVEATHELGWEQKTDYCPNQLLGSVY